MNFLSFSNSPLKIYSMREILSQKKRKCGKHLHFRDISVRQSGGLVRNAPAGELGQWAQKTQKKGDCPLFLLIFLSISPDDECKIENII